MTNLTNLKYINLHTHNKLEDKNSVSIINIYPETAKTEISSDGKFSIGLHPWHIEESTINPNLQIIKEQLQGKNILAIGEIGLDRKCNIDFELQKEVLIM